MAGVPAPEREAAAADAAVEGGGDGEAVVVVVGTVLDRGGDLGPSRLPGRARGAECMREADGIGEGKIEASEDAATVLLEGGQGGCEILTCQRARRRVAGFVAHERRAVAHLQRPPDAVDAGAWHRGGAPVDHQVSVKEGHGLAAR